MRLLRPGQDTVLSWKSGAVECRVVAVAGKFVLLRPERRDPGPVPSGACSLTYLDGLVPMGWDGNVEAGAHPGELRFRSDVAADRRSSVRVPLQTDVRVLVPDEDPQTAELLDISAGGLRFRLSGRLEAGTELRVHTALPGGLVVDADALVRVSEPGVTSVEFTAMHGADGHAVGAWTVAVLRSSLTGSG